jgi:hypothetical protein
MRMLLAWRACPWFFQCHICNDTLYSRCNDANNVTRLAHRSAETPIQSSFWCRRLGTGSLTACFRQSALSWRLRVKGSNRLAEIGRTEETRDHALCPDRRFMMPTKYEGNSQGSLRPTATWQVAVWTIACPGKNAEFSEWPSRSPSCMILQLRHAIPGPTLSILDTM